MDRPTVEELQAMLDTPEEDLSIEVQPDGSIRAVFGLPIHAPIRILTFEQVLGDSY